MLELHNIHAGYGELQVLKGVTITIKQNEIVALIGPNGAGKSTVIKSIFSMTNITAGNIRFQAKDITGLKTHELMQQGISYVPQGRINFGNLTVEENLDVGAMFTYDDKDIEESKQKVYELFPDLNIRKKSLAYGLSGGQQQMLALGRALMQHPTLLLLDEPSLGLSPKLQSDLFNNILTLKAQGIAILIVEQNAKKAIEIADRTYVLEDGKVALEGGKDITKHKMIKHIYLGGR